MTIDPDAILEAVLDALATANGALDALWPQLKSIDPAPRTAELIAGLALADETLRATFAATAPSLRDADLALEAIAALKAALAAQGLGPDVAFNELDL